MSDGLLDTLQEAFADFLAHDVASGAQAFFTPVAPALTISIFAEEKGSLQDQIHTGLARTGLSVLVQTTEGMKADNNQPGKIGFGAVTLVALVSCQPATNRTGIKPRTCCEKIVWLARKFAFEGVTPEHQGISLLPREEKDRAHYAVKFSMGNLFTGDEPMRPVGPLATEGGAPLTTEGGAPLAPE